MLRCRLAILAVLFAGLVGAAVPLGAHDELRFIGTIVRVDAQQNEVAVRYRESGQEQTVAVDLTAETEILRDGTTVSRSELRPGAHVVVDALGCEDEYEAVRIRIVPAPGGNTSR